jgi:peptidoglycan/LPS O-acetylase OafA/YrhL
LWHVVVLDWLIDHGALTWVRGLPYVTLLVVGFAISTGLGTASYFLIELPARRLAHGARRHRREVLAIGT